MSEIADEDNLLLMTADVVGKLRSRCPDLALEAGVVIGAWAHLAGPDVMNRLIEASSPEAQAQITASIDRVLRRYGGLAQTH